MSQARRQSEVAKSSLDKQKSAYIFFLSLILVKRSLKHDLHNWQEKMKLIFQIFKAQGSRG